MKERKRELGYTNEKLSAISGVPVGTLQKIFSGLTKAPRMDTVRALEKVLGKAPSGEWLTSPDQTQLMVRQERSTVQKEAEGIRSLIMTPFRRMPGWS